jgi:PRTRC genetic system protein E
MFKELLPLLRQRTVLMTLALLEDDKVRVNIMPKQTGESENKALCTPLSVTGSAEELDADLPQAIVEFVAAHLTLKESLAQTQAEIEAAGKAAKEALKNKQTAAKGKTAPATSAAKSAEVAKPEPPQLPAMPGLFDSESAATPQQPESLPIAPPTPAAATTETAAAPVVEASATAEASTPNPVAVNEEEDESINDDHERAEADAVYQANRVEQQQDQLLIA